ncbi:MAG: polysaccharide pyruvyl transferase family protein [Gemmobacter sp.]
MAYETILLRTLPDDPQLLTVLVVAPRVPGARDDATMEGKIASLARTFDGQPLIWLYHATVIAGLRRRLDAEANWDRFARLWAAHGDWLLANLDSRWLISACDTIADHHPEATVRAAGLAVSAALNILRLSETERRARGGPDLRPLGRRHDPLRLYDGLRWFAIGKDDTVANLFARLDRVRDDATLPGRILATLLSRATDHDTVFRRLSDAHDDPATRWSPRRAPQLTVALFNDTSTRAHYGCTAVTDSIDRLFGDAGIGIGWRHFVTTNALDDPGTVPAIAAHDAVVVNGEGTMHSSGKKSRALAAIGRLSREAGRKAWLINATLQDNDDAIVADLAAFDHIWVREGASAAWARERGLAVTVMPDLSLCQQLDRPEGPVDGSGMIVIDSVLPQANLRLYRMARDLGGALWTLDHDTEGRMQTLRPRPAAGSGVHKRHWVDGKVMVREPRGGPRDLHQFAAFLMRRRAMITGRYHAVCLALLLRLPFHAVPSNTWKIEAMLADVGLDPARMLGPDDAAPSPLAFSASELAAIDRYIARARFEAGAMAQRILSGY